MTKEEFEEALRAIAQHLQYICEAAPLTKLGVSVRFAPYYSKPSVQLQGAVAGQLARDLGHEAVSNSDHPDGWYAFSVRGTDGRIRPQRHYEWEAGGVAYEAIESVDDLGLTAREVCKLVDEHHDLVEAREAAGA